MHDFVPSPGRTDPLDLSAAEAQAWLAAIVDSSDDAIIGRNLDGVVISWNSGAERIFGYSAGEIVGRPVTILIPPERHNEEAAILAHIRRGERVEHFETVRRRKDGTLFEVSLTASPIVNGSGEIIGTSKIARDISDRQRSEIALRLSEQRFRTAVSIVSSIIWTNTPDGRMEGDQPGWEKFTGQTRREYEGFGWANVVHPEDAQSSIDAWNQAVAERRMFVFSHRLRRADGEWRQCSIRAVPMLDDAGAIIEWVGVHTDITERKQNEEILRASEERMRAFVTASSDVIYRMNADWTEMGELDGRNFLPDSAGPSRTWLHDNIFPEDHAHLLAAIGEAIRTKSVFALEHRVRRLDGTPGWTFSRAVPIFDSEGNVVEWFGAASDATERHRAEEALRISEERYRGLFEGIDEGFCVIQMIYDAEGRAVDYRFLETNPSFERQCGLLNATGKTIRELVPEHEEHWFEVYGNIAATGKLARFQQYGAALGRWFDSVAFRCGEPDERQVAILFTDITERIQLEQKLVARAEELARADRSKDEFLAMLAHELRNPLAPLRNAAELLKMDRVKPDEVEQAQHILSRQIENMSRMIDDLLDVARITRGRIELRKEPVPLEIILNAAADAARPICALRSQRLEVLRPPAPIYVDADATRLEQVFGNLLNNACKYSGDGCTITLCTKHVGDEVAVSVRDDGAGIDPELLPRIFDLFVQASRTLDRSNGGLGIGLTLVHRIIMLHGGTTEARSEGLGRGAEFTVRLPVLSRRPSTEKPKTLPAKEPPRRILVVDDNTDSARSMAILQKRRGHETRTAFTGPDAVSAAADFLPEVVLLDIGLPGMDGFEVARQLRAMPSLESTLIVAMSGYGRDEDRAEGKRAGFDEYMVKPVDLDALRGLLLSRSGGAAER